jgi:TonB-linked SusC/RagA family outer membrane protein
MKRICCFIALLVCCLAFVPDAKAGYDVRMEMKNATVKTVADELAKQTGLMFSYSQSVGNTRLEHVSLNIQGGAVEAILERAFAGTGVRYHINGNKVDLILAGKQKPVQEPAPQKTVQSRKKVRITGVVLDASDKQPLIGVVVRLKSNPTVGNSTDLDGLYVIEADADEVLQFAYMGYDVVEVPVEGRSEINISMSMNQEVLEEAMVVGFGTQKKISVIGAQQSITATDIKVPVANVTNSLAGRVAGVVSIQRSGQPGYDDANIYIRGISTLTASMSAPLTLVDGVPRSISQVDPEDIESFSILKDASATAVYGVRGANGVIIITTKSGKIGKPKFNFRYSEGMTRFVKTPDFVDAPKYMEVANEALMTRGENPRYSAYDIKMTRTGADPFLYPNVDWMDVLFKDFGHVRTANGNISGGSEKANYYIGLSYYSEQGLYNVDKTNHDYNANTFYDRYSVTANINLKPTALTEIKFGVQGYLANANYPAVSQSVIFGSAFYATPNYVAPIYPGGKIGDLPSASVTNPYAVLNEQGYANQWRSQIFSNLRVTQQLPFITEGLSITGMFSFDAYNYTSSTFSRIPVTWQATGRDEQGNLIYQQTNQGSEALSYKTNHQGDRTIYLEAALNYSRSFGKHDVTGLLLYNQSDEVNTMASTLESALPYRFRGLAGRFTYAFDERYFAEFNFGYNGSENFAPGHRFGFFPSVGLGWVMSNEKWFAPAKDVINHFKLRATWGKVGNANITGRRFAYISTVTTGGTVYTFGENMDQSYSQKEIGDIAVDVSWETAMKSNIGLDLMFLDKSLNFQFDMFSEQRKGIFLTRGGVPGYTGISKTPLGNLGAVDNKGLEFSVDYKKQFGRNFYMSVMGNFSYNHNTVVENDIDYAYPWLDLRGQRVGQRYGYIAEKLFESDEEVAASPYQAGDTRAGDIKYKDLNSDGVIDAYDKAPIGWGSTPEIMYGFGFNLSWKGIALSAMFQGAAHVDMLVIGEGVTPFQYGMSRGNLLSNIDDRWTEANPRQDVFYPRLTPGSTNMNYEASTWWLKPADYLRLKNLQLSYTLPSKVCEKIRMNSFTIFLQGVNVFTITPFDIWDVELGDGRGDTYPNISSYSIGLNFNF